MSDATLHSPFPLFILRILNIYRVRLIKYERVRYFAGVFLNFIWKLNPEKLILMITSLFPDPSRCHVLLIENISVQDLAWDLRQKLYEAMNILRGPVRSSQVMAHYSCSGLGSQIRSEDTLSLHLRPLSDLTMQ